MNEIGSFNLDIDEVDKVECAKMILSADDFETARYYNFLICTYVLKWMTSLSPSQNNFDNAKLLIKIALHWAARVLKARSSYVLWMQPSSGFHDFLDQIPNNTWSSLQKRSPWVVASAFTSIGLSVFYSICGDILRCELFTVKSRNGQTWVLLSEAGRRRLFSDQSSIELYDYLTPPGIRVDAILEELLADRNFDPSLLSVPKATVSGSVCRESDPIQILINAFQLSPLAPRKHLNLLKPALRIYLHTLGLNSTDTIGELRMVLSADNAPLRPRVLKLSELYGSLSRAGELKNNDLCPTRCFELALIRKESKKWVELTPQQRRDRDLRWAAWHTFLSTASLYMGPLQLPAWKADQK